MYDMENREDCLNKLTGFRHLVLALSRTTNHKHRDSNRL
jgi:hypothetical protein